MVFKCKLWNPINQITIMKVSKMLVLGSILVACFGIGKSSSRKQIDDETEFPLKHREGKVWYYYGLGMYCPCSKCGEEYAHLRVESKCDESKEARAKRNLCEPKDMSVCKDVELFDVPTTTAAVNTTFSTKASTFIPISTTNTPTTVIMEVIGSPDEPPYSLVIIAVFAALLLIIVFFFVWFFKRHKSKYLLKHFLQKPADPVDAKDLSVSESSEISSNENDGDVVDNVNNIPSMQSNKVHFVQGMVHSDQNLETEKLLGGRRDGSSSLDESTPPSYPDPAHSLPMYPHPSLQRPPTSYHSHPNSEFSHFSDRSCHPQWHPGYNVTSGPLPQYTPQPQHPSFPGGGNPHRDHSFPVTSGYGPPGNFSNSLVLSHIHVAGGGTLTINQQPGGESTSQPPVRQPVQPGGTSIAPSSFNTNDLQQNPSGSPSATLKQETPVASRPVRLFQNDYDEKVRQQETTLAQPFNSPPLKTASQVTSVNGAEANRQCHSQSASEQRRTLSFRPESFTETPAKLFDTMTHSDASKPRCSSSLPSGGAMDRYAGKEMSIPVQATSIDEKDIQALDAEVLDNVDIYQSSDTSAPRMLDRA